MEEFVLCKDCKYARTYYSVVECRKNAMIFDGSSSHGSWPRVFDINTDGCYSGKNKNKTEVL